MPGDFAERMGMLANGIGVGDLEGHIEVDQAYAHYQHEGINRFTGGPLVYHRGGGSHYLSTPLMEHYNGYYESVARHLLDNPAGDGATGAMIDNMKHLAGEVAVRAPVEFSNLRQSAHAWVTEAGETVWDQPPAQHRLSEGELAALSKASGGHKYGH